MPEYIVGHKITNVPPIWKVGDIILFSWAKLSEADVAMSS
jgi:hypothetical protein